MQSRHVNKFSPESEIARYRNVCQQPGQLLSVWLSVYKLSFTLKLWHVLGFFVILKLQHAHLNFSVSGWSKHVQNEVALVWGSLRLAPIRVSDKQGSTVLFGMHCKQWGFQHYIEWRKFSPRMVMLALVIIGWEILLTHLKNFLSAGVLGGKNILLNHSS